MQKYYFYETMKMMVFLYFCAFTINVSYGGFTLRKIIHMGLGFLLCHNKKFYFIFDASNESEYAMQKINMDNY
jgi:hypothetical protein